MIEKAKIVKLTLESKEKKEAIAREKQRKEAEAWAKKQEKEIDNRLLAAAQCGESSVTFSYNDNCEETVRELMKKYHEYNVEIKVEPPDEGEDDRTVVTITW